MEIPSKLLENAVNEIAQLPGIGKRTALRLALHLLKQPDEQVERLAESMVTLKKEIKKCKSCFTLSDFELCSICEDTTRDTTLICVVEDVRDVMAIENTSLYKGTYHVLGGKINPMEGVGPSQLTIDALVNKIQLGEIKEVVFALSSTIEGDTTNFYIFKKIQNLNIKTSAIARGIAIGDELEYADEVTLGRSLMQRVSFESTLKST